jgi:hypothetical protein
VKPFFAFCIALFISNKSFSQEWIFLTMQKETDSIFMKSNYVSKVDDEGRRDVIKIWIKTYQKHLSFGKKSYENGEVRTLWYIDCEAKQYKMTNYVLYDHSRSLINSHSDDFAKYEDVVPDTIGESIINKVCSTFNN